jgi:hypothetical protein
LTTNSLSPLIYPPMPRILLKNYSRMIHPKE